MTRRIIPLIMCGGAGTRLWPASREVHPKQFLSLFGARSTFQDTLLRVSDPDLFERPVIITNNAYRFMVLEQLAEIGREAIKEMLPMQPGDVTETFADVGDLVRDVGFRPATLIADGIRDFVAWYRNHYRI